VAIPVIANNIAAQRTDLMPLSRRYGATLGAATKTRAFGLRTRLSLIERIYRDV